jgi:outer membrane immunogenic protein
MLAMSSVSQAADPVVDVVEMHDWSGIYAGVNAGYGWGDRDWDDDAGIFPDETFRYDLRGAVAGAQIGYNFQADSFVFGIEADGAWGDMRDTVSEFGGFITAESEVEWLATIRGRAGFAWDRFMVYGTGGIAFAEVDTDVTTIFIGSDSDAATHTGWVAGIGFEGMITERISLKAEYLHADFGKESFDYYAATNGSADLDLDIVRIGVNWHF